MSVELTTADQNAITASEQKRLGKAIAKLHMSAWSAAQNAVADAIEAGMRLAEAKEKLPHGSWSDFVEQDCKMSIRTAQRYMKAARDETIKLSPFFETLEDPFDRVKIEATPSIKNDTVSYLPPPPSVTVPIDANIEASIDGSVDATVWEDVDDVSNDAEVRQICDRMQSQFDVEAASLRLCQLLHHELDNWPHEHLSKASDVVLSVISNRVSQ